MMYHKTFAIILFTLSIAGCTDELTSLEFNITCKSKGKDILKPEFYVDGDFVGSIDATCDDNDIFDVKLKAGTHNVRISVDNKTIYRKDVKILGTDDSQEIAVDIP